MLAFHILNVGHGSSIVIEFEHNAERHFGVVDSNCVAGATPRAIEKLRELGAQRLSFLVLTHPHKDHFSGLYEIVRAYDDRIAFFYSCPFGDLLQHADRLKAFGRGLVEIMNKSDGMEQRLAARELAQILYWADTSARNGSVEWHECKGDDLVLAPPGFAQMTIRSVLPPSRVVGNYVQRIMRGDMAVFGRFDDNEISLALLFTYRGSAVLLGGDGTVSNWEARRRFERNSETRLDAAAVNLPHHGSKHDCPPAVLDQLFAKPGSRYGVTSGDGHRHPDVEVVKWLAANKIKPYCTNLIPSCGANAQNLLVLPNLQPEFARWIREVANTNRIQTCQGDVTIRIDDAGQLSVAPQHNNLCAYRDDFRTYLGI